MKKLFSIVFLLAAIADASAAVTCRGTVATIYKWSDATTISIQIRMNDGTMTNWTAMPSKSDEAMALVAYTTGKPVELYWASDDVSTCNSGWQHNRVLAGIFLLGN